MGAGLSAAGFSPESSFSCFRGGVAGGRSRHGSEPAGRSRRRLRPRYEN